MANHPPESAANPAVAEVSRAAWRSRMVALRQAMPVADHQAASSAILRHLENLLMPTPAGTLAFCWPIRGEVDCRPLVTRLIDRGWRAAMPVVVGPAAPMEFRAWTPDTMMTADPYGIPVPAVFPPSSNCQPDVLLLPLVAFDAAGYRLGYGGGYFDRTLAALSPRPLTVGVGFECTRMASIAPEPHDVPLAVIVTERGVQYCDPP